MARGPVGHTHSALPIIAIGGSAGAIKPILGLLGGLPANLSAIILIVIHRSPAAPSLLPEVIAQRSPTAVHLAQEGLPLDHPMCVVASPDKHMVVSPQLRVHLISDGYYRSSNIDLLFNSLARAAGNRTIGVILSGLLKDGTEGLRAIKESGGVALVQSPAEAEYPDMPESAIQFDGLIDFVGPVTALADEIRRRVQVGEDVHAVDVSAS